MIISFANKKGGSSLLYSIELLKNILSQRIQSHFNNGNFELRKWIASNPDELPLENLFPQLPQKLSCEELIIIITALLPHVIPNFFESLIVEHMPNGGDFPEFGGVKATSHRSMLPTGETVQFILAGNNIEERLHAHEYFSDAHFFSQQQILWLESVKEGEPVMSGRIVLSQEWVDKLLFHKETPPRFGLDFPAKRVHTSMLWEDAVLHPHTIQQVNDLAVWLKHNHKLNDDENLKRKIKPGYRVLFYGPSGTGKTLTAALLGKEFSKEVYRIDLSQIVSKYIGETEKNLEGVFKRAESKNWILFFDEADALFGKRTNVQSAHDKYANQEVSYLLQRVEDYSGLLILASNFKNNLDEAFIRRFHSVVHFPMPNSNERLLLWQKSMPSNLTLHKSVNLEELSVQYEMTGASILNAVHFSVLQAYSRGKEEITQNDLMNGIQKEFIKEEKSV